MNTKTCGYCVPAEELSKAHRQWMLMCWLCTLLLTIVAVIGVLALNWREELSETRISLDIANEQLAVRAVADAKELKVKPRRKNP